MMAVLNVTPDSFSDGGNYVEPQAALDQARALIRAGADVLDIGGESTRPGSEPVSADEEMHRVLPVIEQLIREGVKTPLSIDTTKADVARAALVAGATWVNDVSGGTFQPQILKVAAEAGATTVLGHTRAEPKHMQQGTWQYEGGVVRSVRSALSASMDAAQEAGVRPDRIWLDPGIGFGKTLEENLDLLRNLEALRIRGCPILVGTSRKAFLGRLTGRPAPERDFATAASVALAIQSGADGVRIHHAVAMGDVIRVADAWVRGNPAPDGP